MECERCGKDPDLIIVLPAKKSDGCLNEIVCYDCALKASAYCNKHQMPHLGFIDDETTACKLCIEEKVLKNMERAEEIHAKLKAGLPFKEMRDIEDWARELYLLARISKKVSILRLVVIRALRLGISIDETIERAIKSQTNLFPDICTE